jgi:hypothetical protein
VAADQQRAPGGRESGEQLPEVAAQHRVEPHGGLVEHQQLGRAQERGRQAHARHLPARQGADELVGTVGQPHVRERAGGGGTLDAVDVGEVVQVLPDGEVAVHRRALGDVADLAAQPRRTGGLAQHVHLAGDAGLHADDGAHQGRLAAAARPEQAAHRPPRHDERQPVQHLVAASDHRQASYLNSW